MSNDFHRWRAEQLEIDRKWRAEQEAIDERWRAEQERLDRQWREQQAQHCRRFFIRLPLFLIVGLLMGWFVGMLCR